VLLYGPAITSGFRDNPGCLRRSNLDARQSRRRKACSIEMPSERVRKLLAEAAELPTEERAELVDELARTLPETYEQDELDLDYDELDKRMEAVRRGTAVLIPWDEARRQILPGK
jgi:16S rRNA C1402 (ribose-2'-O) methylase RsmI